MIEIIHDLPDNVLGLAARGEVTAEDYKDVVVPALEEKLSKKKRVRLLYVLGEDFENYSPGAAWEDAKVGMKHLSAFDRVAVVTDVDWVETAVRAFGFAMPCEVRVFDDDDLQDAREWISEPLPEGDLSFELMREEGILAIRPNGEIQASDFRRIAEVVDPYIEQTGVLHGVMVEAEHFPGWDDFSAFTSHLRFVKDHHNQIRRVAIVTNDQAVSSIPRVAKHFVQADVQRFPTADRERALEWLRDR